MSITFTGPVPVPVPQSSGLSVLITGASRGIGFELVQQYAAAHSDNVVVAAARDPSTATALTSFASSHPNVHVVALDVTKEASVKASVAHVQRVTKRLDVLINNAGYYGEPEAGDTVTVTAEQLRAVFEVNVVGQLLVTQAYLPLLRQSTVGGKVINVSSALGSHTYAAVFGKPTVSYGLSKAALNFLTTVFRQRSAGGDLHLRPPGVGGHRHGQGLGWRAAHANEGLRAGHALLRGGEGHQGQRSVPRHPLGPADSLLRPPENTDRGSDADWVARSVRRELVDDQRRWDVGTSVGEKEKRCDFRSFVR